MENAFGILSEKFQIYQRTLKSLPENADNIIFANCILYNYLRDQVVGLNDMGSSPNGRSNFTKIPNQGEVPTKVLLKYGTNLKNSSIVRLDLCLVRMKECNVRLICNNQLSSMLS